jgi:hypothetical protein
MKHQNTNLNKQKMNQFYQHLCVLIIFIFNIHLSLFSNVNVNVVVNVDAQIIQWPISNFKLETDTGVTKLMEFQPAQFAPQLQSTQPVNFQLFAPLESDSSSAQLGCDTMTKPTNQTSSFAMIVSRGICDYGKKKKKEQI